MRQSSRKILTFAILLLALTACATTEQPAVQMTINARDESGVLIEPVNVWKDYQDRSKGVAGQAHDGERVGFIRREGAGALIRLSDGTEGWINAAFLR